MPLGKVSLTVVVPVELDGPALVTVIWYWPVPPAVKVPCATFATERSKLMFSGVGPVLTGPLLPGLPSDGLLTVAVLAASGSVALGEMVMSSSNMLLPLARIELLLVQVMPGTVPVQVQPGLEIGLTL